MKLVVDRLGDYYISIKPDGVIDSKIAEVLDTPIEEYNQILMDSGAHKVQYFYDQTNIGYEFKRKSDAEKAIKILEPYLVMANLLK